MSESVKQYCERVLALVDEFKTGRHLAWRDRGGGSGEYVRLCDADSPGLGYHDDGCRTCPTKLAEVAEDTILRLCRKLGELYECYEDKCSAHGETIAELEVAQNEVRELRIRLDEARRGSGAHDPC